LIFLFATYLDLAGAKHLEYGTEWSTREIFADESVESLSGISEMSDGEREDRE
jgi:hypothetical protein